jgi:hypothetical protein
VFFEKSPIEAVICVNDGEPTRFLIARPAASRSVYVLSAFPLRRVSPECRRAGLKAPAHHLVSHHACKIVVHAKTHAAHLRCSAAASIGGAVPQLSEVISLRPCPGSLSAACSCRLRVGATHGAAAFAPTAGTHVRPTFLLLLIGVALRFLALRAREVLLILALALVFRGAGFFQGDGYGLPSAFNLATLSSRSTLEFAVRELMHDASSRFSLSGRGGGHGGFLSKIEKRQVLAIVPSVPIEWSTGRILDRDLSRSA